MKNYENRFSLTYLIYFRYRNQESQIEKNKINKNKRKVVNFVS